MRTFVAIELPNEIKSYLFEIQNKLKNLPAKIKWVAKKHLHLCLLFIGEVNENKLQQIKERLNKIKFKKFEVHLDKIRFFPDENYIRIIWVGLNPKDKIIKLQQKIDSELLDLIKRDKEFKAHLTLGRVKFVKNKQEFKEKLKIEIEKKNFEINEFKLIKSDLSKDGPQYTNLEVYKLK